MLEALDLYLHCSTLSQPVEFFHSVLLTVLHGVDDSVWAIQEEDPATHRYVTDDHFEAMSRRRQREPANPAFVEELGERLRADGAECVGCEFAAVCRGYFKWPDRDYDCGGVKAIFGGIRAAAEGIAEDIEMTAGA